MGGEQINVTEPYGGSRTSYHDPPKSFDPPPPPTLTSQPLSGRLTMTDPWVFIQRLSKSLSFIKRGVYFVYIWYTSFKSANCNRPLHYAPMHLLISLPCFIWRVDTSKIAWSSFINTVCYNMTNVYDKSTLPWTCWFFFFFIFQKKKYPGVFWKMHHPF